MRRYYGESIPCSILVLMLLCYPKEIQTVRSNLKEAIYQSHQLTQGACEGTGSHWSVG